MALLFARKLAARVLDRAGDLTCRIIEPGALSGRKDLAPREVAEMMSRESIFTPVGVLVTVPSRYCGARTSVASAFASPGASDSVVE